MFKRKLAGNLYKYIYIYIYIYISCYTITEYIGKNIKSYNIQKIQIKFYNGWDINMIFSINVWVQKLQNNLSIQ